MKYFLVWLMFVWFASVSAFAESGPTESAAELAKAQVNCEKRLLAQFADFQKGQSKLKTATSTECFQSAMKLQEPYATYPFECEKVIILKDAPAAQKIVPFFKEFLGLQTWGSPEMFKFDELNKMVHSSLFAPIYAKCLDVLESERAKKTQ